MKKKKETSQPQVSHALRVYRQRSKKNSIVIESVLTTKDRCFTGWSRSKFLSIPGLPPIYSIVDKHRRAGKTSRGDYQYPPVNFRIIIQEDEFKKLYFYAHNNSDFTEQFSHILFDAWKKCDKTTRGTHKSHKSEINCIKTRASFLYNLFLFINETNVKPAYFIDFIETIPTDEKLYFVKKKGYDPIILTAYFLEKEYGQEQLLAMKLKPFYSEMDPDSFYIKYIQPQRKEYRIHFVTEFRSILWKLCGVEYLLIEGKTKPRIYSDYHAKYSYSKPCNKNGKEINIHYGKENIHYDDALAKLFEVMRQDALYHNQPLDFT